MGCETEALTQDEFLGGRLKLWQPRTGYRAATDPVLLAAACPAQKGQSVLDLGCGVGTAGLCLAARVPVNLTGLELQPDYAELARRNAAANAINMRVVTGDVAEMPAQLREENFDHVIMNPPFFGPGKPAADPGRALGRQEETSLTSWLDSALKRLKPKGWLSLILTIERYPEVIVALNERAGAINIKPLAPRLNRPATRFLLKARKGSRGAASLANPLILHEGDTHLQDQDSFTTDAKSLLRDANPLKF